MKDKKSVIFCGIFVIIFAIILTADFFYSREVETPKEVYQVYLDGEKIGLIESRDELYNLINKEQIEIKNEYKVDQVYPPRGFKLIKKNTYDENLSSAEEIYNYIKDKKPFTIKGYTITVKKKDSKAEPVYVNVIDSNLFDKSVNNVINTFIGEERYKQYRDNTQPEITDTGYTIEKMYFNDNIKIKEAYISVDEKIYTNENELTKYLLFGDINSYQEYIVKQGDTIENIAYDNELNSSELIIANDNIDSEDTLLRIGQKLNVALINPVLSLVYEEIVVEDVVQYYETEYVNDPTQYIGYKKTTREGQNGINRTTARVQFVNGNASDGVFFIGEDKVIKPVVNKVIAKGTKKLPSYGGEVIIVDDGSEWLWPVNSYYIISGYGWRSGVFHDGVDIPRPTGTPVYASLDGIVVNAGWCGYAGCNSGINVVVLHPNGYSTVYAHLSRVSVSNGQQVKRGQKVGEVGMTGMASGPHLHLGVFPGLPYQNTRRGLNPLQFYR